ncbi:16S rRNA (cytidine1402-2'-O)-methyltransferase [Kineococcus xinjiangensis]|uniref:Ribosomal RNA small subunit methyltransferase I n=1 Tax=Kineococcus xinjiangensis TaxID=512762 RepID=A0A2S6ISY7_9ACTN|nr:16S rRNA (cytidine(1402)-2'-O)-methyltransferase [Kineococcus xinjiangensis]PPK97281.1 16S rRNA (cytidine1402-2'-O)-methyltransferase [Kineococcus xinjiangensis]
MAATTDGAGAGAGSAAAGGGRLVLAATPIGNALDASPRLARLLAEADVVAAEDTRRTRRLCADLGVEPRGRMLSYHEHNESARTPELVAAVAEGAVVALVTDAGMPSVSDPGYRLTRACVDAGLPVTAVPGPSAVLTALAVSGLPVDRFAFEGFCPRKPGERSRALAALAREQRTLVFFEAPHRTAATLEAMAAAFGADRPAAVCRELTKTYEEVVRLPLGELAAWAAAGEVRGEVCLVVAPAPAGEAPPVQDLVGQVLALVADGSRLKDAVAAVADATGVVKRELYEAAAKARGGSARR